MFTKLLVAAIGAAMGAVPGLIVGLLIVSGTYGDPFREGAATATLFAFMVAGAIHLTGKHRQRLRRVQLQRHLASHMSRNR